ncbi:MAG: hypothetical protein C0511_09235 [Hyphomicrobium sp.]|nr:hypothetical protein [Hyphomicrobium sp.]
MTFASFRDHARAAHIAAAGRGERYREAYRAENQRLYGHLPSLGGWVLVQHRSAIHRYSPLRPVERIPATWRALDLIGRPFGDSPEQVFAALSRGGTYTQSFGYVSMTKENTQ